MYGPYYGKPTQHHTPVRTWDSGVGGGGVGFKPFSHDLWIVICPPNFKSSAINKYDWSNNPTEWLEVYQLVIEAAGGDSYDMDNYLSIYLSSSARTCLIRLPTSSVRSWSDLCKQFVRNFRATYE
jgi:hypothetical protein